MREITIEELFESGVHYGHSRTRWNPKMEKYIHSVRNGIHVIDITKTLPMIETALKAIQQIVSNNGRILFVGTKPHASPIIKETADICGQYYINHRWLGGILTNWNTVAKSIKRLEGIEKTLANPEGLTKKEILKINREYEKLEKAIGGVRKMGGLPQALIIIDVVKERTAVLEGKRLKIPVFGIVDSNADPDIVDYPIPGNDDAIRAIRLYCELFKDAILEGLQKSVKASGIDIGESSESPMDKLLKEDEVKKMANKKMKKAKMPKDNVTSDNMRSGNVTSENMTRENMTRENVTSENMKRGKDDNQA